MMLALFCTVDLLINNVMNYTLYLCSSCTGESVLKLEVNTRGH